MKKILFISLCIFLYTSCATQNAAITKEAEKKVEDVKTLINLTDVQAEKLVAIETEYLKESKKLTYSASYNDQLNQIKEKRISRIKEILSRDQFIKFDMMENNRIKKLPVRF